MIVFDEFRDLINAQETNQLDLDVLVASDEWWHVENGNEHFKQKKQSLYIKDRIHCLTNEVSKKSPTPDYLKSVGTSSTNLMKLDQLRSSLHCFTSSKFSSNLAYHRTSRRLISETKRLNTYEKAQI